MVVRRNCKQLWRGDRSFIPQMKRLSPTALLVHTLVVMINVYEIYITIQNRSVFMFGRQLAMALWGIVAITTVP